MGVKGKGDTPRGIQGGGVGDVGAGSQGRREPAFQPACASWMAGIAPWCRMNAVTGARGWMWLSDQMPRSPGEMRPSGDTEVASAMTTAAPPRARAPRCTRWKWLARPSWQEYMHMGETPMRLRKVRDRWVSGEKSMGDGRLGGICFGHHERSAI